MESIDKSQRSEKDAVIRMNLQTKVIFKFAVLVDDTSPIKFILYSVGSERFFHL
jgi:hypothetical protein